MATYAVRRLGVAPCTVSDYKTMVKREELVKKGDKEALKKFDEELVKKGDKEALKKFDEEQEAKQLKTATNENGGNK